LNRCNVLLLDEYRLISKTTIDTVLRKFLTLRRMPKYEELTDEERKREYDKEKNLTMYLSSAYWKNHWSYSKCVDTFNAMLEQDSHKFVCGFPYQLSIEEGLLDPELVKDDMSESDFSEVKFSMEMEALFFGSDDGAFFDFDSVSKNRHINFPMLPDEISSKLVGASQVRIPHKQNGEVRILSADIALMSSKKNNNDATAIFINQLIPTKARRYINNIVYTNAYEGLRTDEQALIIRKLFDEYECDYLVLDTQGVGLGTFDALACDIVDPETGEIYPAISCCNDSTMAERCTVRGADKVIWSIKASAKFNSDAAFRLREAFRTGRIRLLVSEYEMDKYLESLKGFKSLSKEEKLEFQNPYVQTTMLILELKNLQHEESNGNVRIYEKSGMRKDRYSSLAYNYYVATQIENKMNRRTSLEDQPSESFIIKPPQYKGKAVNNRYGINRGWY